MTTYEQFSLDQFMREEQRSTRIERQEIEQPLQSGDFTDLAMERIESRLRRREAIGDRLTGRLARLDGMITMYLAMKGGK